jgi:acyl-CoA thioester hydrolase
MPPDFPFSLETTVPAEDIDEMGHVNNVAYLRYVELIAREHSKAVGLSIERYGELGGAFLVRQHNVTYHQPAVLGDRLLLRTRIRELGGVRAVREVHILRDDVLLAEAQTVWVWVDSQTRRPKRIPQEVLEKLPAT